MRALVTALGILALSSIAAKPYRPATHYVSPSGSDANPGTSSQPWASFYHAAATLLPGETAIFADGVYNETQYRPTTAFANNGVTIRAAHPRQATLNFQGVSNATAIWLIGRSNVTIRDMVLTKPKMGTSYDDGLVRCWSGSDNCQLVNDVFSNAYEPVKFADSADDVLDHSLLTGSNVAFGAFAATRPVIKLNEFDNSIDSAVQTKGGTLSAQVHDNVIRGQQSVGIYLGGGSCGSACGVHDVVSGYEGDHNSATNNLIDGGSYGAIVFEGCNQCSASGNTIQNAAASFQFISNFGWPQPDGTIRYVPTTGTVIL